MGVAVVMVTYYAAYSIGETVDQLLAWFDKWVEADRENTECTRTGTPGCDSRAGSSLFYDLSYHMVTLVYSWFLYTFMIFGVHWLASQNMKFNELENCDLEGLDRSHYADAANLLAQQVDMPSCKASVKAIFRIADLDNNGHISRCESAKFMYAIGNTQNYALNYNQEEALSLLYA